MSDHPLVELNNGHKIPVIGLGTLESPPGEVGDAVKLALENGYRHFDCAPIYLNEKEIGVALKEAFSSGKVKREDVFVTSKLWNTCHAKKDVRNGLLATLEALQLEYLDLYLIHVPVSFEFTGLPLTPENLFPTHEDGSAKVISIPLSETWAAMEELVNEGLVKSIGVSNFNTLIIQELLSFAKIKPVVNQIELHPYLVQSSLLRYMEKNNIKAVAYSPLGFQPPTKTLNPIDDPLIVEISKKYNKAPSQVLLRWAIDRGTIIIPKSVKSERIAQNQDIFDFKLTEEEVESIKGLDRNGRFSDLEDFLGLNIFA